MCQLRVRFSFGGQYTFHKLKHILNSYFRSHSRVKYYLKFDFDKYGQKIFDTYLTFLYLTYNKTRFDIIKKVYFNGSSGITKSNRIGMMDVS